jgi:uncharacterized alkaline shock family protein YloU
MASSISLPCYADPAVASEPESAVVDPGDRGALVVRDKVAQRVAMHAALATPGVLPHSAGLDKLTGRDLPRVRVDVSATRVRAHLSIAVAWPESLSTVGAAVQHNVSQALTDSAGFVVDGVDVAIEAIVTAPAEPTRTVS